MSGIFPADFEVTVVVCLTPDGAFAAQIPKGKHYTSHPELYWVFGWQKGPVAIVWD